MRYYLFRLQKQVALSVDQTHTIHFDFIPPDCTNIENGDKVLIYVSESLNILGSYVKKDDTFVLEKSISEKTLKDIWTKFEFVLTLTENTSRLFKKKMREMSQTEYEAVFTQLQK